MSAVSVEHITKTYVQKEQKKEKKVTALDDVSFTVDKGELFGIIGPDGAGKTTLFRILTTVLLADSGRATVEGMDVVKDYRKIRDRVGYMPGKFSLYQDLTVEENLNFFATIFNTTVKKNYELIKEIYVQLEPFKKRRAGALSGGMKQKLALCCALIHKPSILFLDEPTTGVDPVSRRDFWDMIKKLKEQDIAILVSTAYMDEANMCEKIALIQNGNILTVSSPEQIISEFDSPLLAVRSDDMYQLLYDLRANRSVQEAYPFGAYYHVIPDTAGQAGELQQYLEQKGQKGLEVKPIKANIEDSFIALMKKKA
jgi:ABC-type multidrug transport system ATPase subunit